MWKSGMELEVDEIKCLFIFPTPFIAIQGEACTTRGREASEVIASSLS